MTPPLRATLLGLLALLALPPEGEARPTPRLAFRGCSSEVLAEIRALDPDPGAPIHLACRLKLERDDVVTKRIVIEGSRASGTVIDCGGGQIGSEATQPLFPDATIEIRSVPVTHHHEPAWDRPVGVTIRNCTINGPIRIWGMGRNGQGEAVRASSRALGHTERAQAAAPTRIRIENSTLRAFGAIPLYLGPGVTETVLARSRILGRSGSTAIYLDAESARNALLGNSFEIATGREVVAVDGSAENRIEENLFRIGWRGGVFLYRNCGEGGTVRHQTPSRNVIRANRFVYGQFPHLAAISVGARSGWATYCHEDAGYPFGSSIDDGDNATGNVVEANVVEERFWGD